MPFVNSSKLGHMSSLFLSYSFSSHTLPASLSPPLLEGKREEEKEREAEGERERDRQTENTRGIKL